MVTNIVSLQPRHTTTTHSTTQDDVPIAADDAAADTADKAADTAAATVEGADKGDFEGAASAEDGDAAGGEITLDIAAEGAANTTQDQRWLFDKKNSASMLTSYVPSCRVMLILALFHR